MRASPAGLRWERPRNPGSPRGRVMTTRAPCSFRRAAGARVPDHGLHPVLRDELQLLELADAPLVVRGQKAAPVERGELLVVLLVVLAQLAEVVALRGEPLIKISVSGMGTSRRGQKMKRAGCVHPAGSRLWTACVSASCVLPWGLPRFQSCRLQGCLGISAYTPAVARLSRLVVSHEVRRRRLLEVCGDQRAVTEPISSMDRRVMRATSGNPQSTVTRM